MRLSLAFSPCPNDTFLFHAFVNNLVSHSFSLNVTLADIQQLNELALRNAVDICKVSFPTFLRLEKDYCLLPVGAALGNSNGPKIVAATHFPLEKLCDLRIAIPGKDTTAYRLYKLLTPKARREVFCLYHEIPALIRSGQVDCGLIIHETRFTLSKERLIEICDLGLMWERDTHLPLPLGGLVAKRSLGSDTLSQIISCLQSSLRYARQNQEASRAYILQHSREKDWDVARAHIDLYVNEDTEQISSRGREAIALLLHGKKSSRQ